MGRSVGISRICWVKSFKIPLFKYRSFSMEPAYAVSTTNMPFEAGSLLKLEKILAFSSVLTITIVYFSGKVTMVEVWMEGHQQSEHAGHRQVRGRSRETERQAASRRGSDQERMFLAIRKRPFFVVEANRGSKQNKVSQWGHLWV